jgi:hypothetical protein
VPTLFQPNLSRCHFALFHGQIQNFLGRVVAFLPSGGQGRPVPTGRGRTLPSNSDLMHGIQRPGSNEAAKLQFVEYKSEDDSRKIPQ